MNRLTYSLLAVTLSAAPVLAQGHPDLPLQPFDELTLRWVEDVPGDTMTWVANVDGSSGAVRLSQSDAPIALGRAPRYMLDALNVNLRRAELASIDAVLPDGPNPEPFRLSVRYPDRHRVVRGDRARLAELGLDFRLNRVIGSVAEIRDHVLRTENSRAVVRGTVRVDGAEVHLVQSSGSIQVYHQGMTRLLREWDGHPVTLNGSLAFDGSEGELHDWIVLNPNPMKRRRAHIQLDGHKPEVVLGFGATTHPTPTFGDAAQALVIAEGGTAQFDGYAFFDPADQQITKIYIESVSARLIRESSAITCDLTSAGLLPIGELVKITRVQRNVAFVQARGLEGAIWLEDLSTSLSPHSDVQPFGSTAAGPSGSAPAEGSETSTEHGFAGALGGE